MLTPIIFLTSIILITFGAWLMGRMGWAKICPICAGVLITWVWILVGIYAGILEGDNWLRLVTMAMGGSVVGFAYFMEKRMLARRSIGEGGPPGRSAVLWKAIFIPTGFLGVYGVLSGLWLLVLGAAVAGIWAFVHFMSPPVSNGSRGKAASIKKSLKDCC